MKKFFSFIITILLIPELHNDINNNNSLISCNVYNDYLKFASKNGDLKLAKHCLKKGATNLNDCLNIASQYNHIKIVKLLTKKGASNFYDAHAHAFLYKNMEIAEFLKNKKNY